MVFIRTKIVTFVSRKYAIVATSS